MAAPAAAVKSATRSAPSRWAIDAKPILDRAELRGETIANGMRGLFAVAGVAIVVASSSSNTPATQAILMAQAGVWAAYAIWVWWLLRRSPGLPGPWLKYLSIAVDQAVVAATYFAARNNYAGVLEYWHGGTLELFTLLNLTSGLRLSPLASLYAGALTVLTNVGLLIHTVLTHAVPVVEKTAWAQPAIHIPDTLLTILMAALPGAVAALIARASRQLLLRAEEESARRVGLQVEYDRLGKYLPREVVAYVVDHPDRQALGGKRRTATILFVDIRNFTSLSERLPPEETVALLNEFFAEMVAIVFRYGGTLDKFLGDGFMAVFGAPLDLPEAPSRAAMAAVDMVLATRTLAAFMPNGALALKIGAGMATGEVLSGTIGSPDRMEFTSIGPAVNLASRLESLNKRFGTNIILADTTRQLLDPGLGVHALGAVPVRGLSGEVTVWGIDVDQIADEVLRPLRQRLSAPVAQP